MSAGMDEDEARQKLEEAGFEVEVRQARSSATRS